ncbi:hypothetical protein [Fusobacterium necrophorum]|uniref:hypothetical protein n=1 Tax=Fusobacterium necrophorum TaxID=859 RepID=UPI00370E54FD
MVKSKVKGKRNEFDCKYCQEEKKKIIGRIGGNVPCFFLDKEKTIKEYRFYMVFQNPNNPKEFFSIFIPNEYGFMLDRNIYPNCSVKVFSHAFSKESKNTEYTLGGINKAHIIGYDQVDNNKFDFITKARTPKLLQDETYYTEKLKKDGYEFFIQVDENYYTNNLLQENYIFGYGALYLYKHRESGDVIAGFWQYS